MYSVGPYTPDSDSESESANIRFAPPLKTRRTCNDLALPRMNHKLLHTSAVKHKVCPGLQSVVVAGWSQYLICRHVCIFSCILEKTKEPRSKYAWVWKNCSCPGKLSRSAEGNQFGPSHWRRYHEYLHVARWFKFGQFCRHSKLQSEAQLSDVKLSKNRITNIINDLTHAKSMCWSFGCVDRHYAWSVL